MTNPSIQRIRDFTPEEFYQYVKDQIDRVDIESNDKYRLAFDLDRHVDKAHESEREFRKTYTPKEWFKRKFKPTIDTTLNNIEKTMDGQPIYREIVVCNPKDQLEVDLTRPLLKEPIGSSWSYYDDTLAIEWGKCPDTQTNKPILIKAQLLNPEGIDVDASLIVNMNWDVASASENEIRLKKGAKVHVTEICEKRWVGSRRVPLKDVVKHCHPTDQIFHN